MTRCSSGGSDSITRRSVIHGAEDPFRFWERRCPTYQRCAEDLLEAADRLTLPRPYAEMMQLPEAHLLREIIFGTDRGGRQRAALARRLEASQAATHLDLCRTLTDTAAPDSPLRTLHAFSRLADAGMDVVHRLASALHDENTLSITQATKITEIEEACAELSDAADAWRNTPQTSIRHVETAYLFANTARSADPATCLKAVVQSWGYAALAAVVALAILGHYHMAYFLWQASVEGTTATVRRADHTLLSVDLPPGATRVDLVFSSRAFVAGKWITAASLLLTMLWFAVSLRRAPVRVSTIAGG